MTLHRTFCAAAILGSIGAMGIAGVACGTSSAGSGSTGLPSSGDTSSTGPNGTGSNSGEGAQSSGGGTDNGLSGGSGSAGGGGTGSGSVGSGSGGGGGSGQGSGTGSGSSGHTSGSSGAISDAGVVNTPPTPHMGQTCLKPGAADFSTKGPYTVTKSSVDLGAIEGLPDAGPTTYSIFTPGPLNDNCPHPVVAWGNGTGVTGSSTQQPAGACTGTATIDCLSGTYDFFNVYTASYGIVVIASDNSNVGSGVYHKAAIDYMMKQNADPKSQFYQKLSTRVGTSGHSQGGIGATIGANLIGSQLEAEVCVAGGGQVTKNNNFLCLTGTMDQAESACKGAVSGAAGVAFLADWDGGDHVTTETLAGYTAGQEGTHQMMHLMAAWFRCFLADDQAGCKLFQGGTPSNCGICKTPGWAILQSKGL